MKYRRMLWTLLVLLFVLPMGAQNSIDKMVEEYSTMGGATFTTAVERDPNTRRVKKVVKRLSVNGFGASKFINCFKREAQRQRHTVKTVKDGETTMTVVTDSKAGTRVYMLKYSSASCHPDATITIVIVPK